jgi:hypothetical protein
MRNANRQEALLRKLYLIRSQLDECLSVLKQPGVLKSQRKLSAIKRNQDPARVNVGKLDFEQPIVAFIKKHVGTMSGPKKFTLLLARLTKGDLKKEISLQDIKSEWSRMTRKPLLGMKFNRFYASQARQQDWVELKKKGMYRLRPSWQQIFAKM